MRLSKTAIFLLGFCFFLCVGCGSPKPATSSSGKSNFPNALFSLSVVPTTSFVDGDTTADALIEGTITMAQKDSRVFYVVLTNISQEPQAVWEYWNSWGYQTISFELTTADRQNFVISKRQQNFTRNAPSTFLVGPGEHQAFSIQLDQEWVTHPSLSKADETPVTLKAIYEVLPTPNASEYRVWTGRLESRIYRFTLRQW